MRIISIIVIIIVSVPSFSWAKFNIGGSYENHSIFDAGNNPSNYLNNSQLKIELNYKDLDWRLYSDIRLGLLYGASDLISASNNLIYTGDTNKDNRFGITLEIPRMYLKLNTAIGNITIGRSYVTFGQPYIFNALEWDKNFSLVDPLATKAGVNLVSLDVGIGSYGKANIFVGGNDEWDTVLGGAELILGLDSFEMGLVYQYKGYNDNVVGAFFKADILIGLFGSYAAHLNDIFSGADFNSSQEFSIGADYSFPIGVTTLLIQQIFYFNSSGATTVDELQFTTFGDYYYRGQTYSYTSFKLTIDQFTTVGTDVIVNIHDSSGAVLPRFLFTLTNNLTLDIAMAIFWGDTGSEFAPSNKGMPNISILAKLIASF